eukprot:TRINITY_DN12999_c1_g1_i1.p1 TRINITY_DN12999_c1_g1~~TRINITY_DN12999_c1_g1_i1.p1  ORF type:complete len:262 (+),score=85.81 TRINITY_DN12999_c1_g1_i1:671-1456(+)
MLLLVANAGDIAREEEMVPESVQQVEHAAFEEETGASPPAAAGGAEAPTSLEPCSAPVHEKETEADAAIGETAAVEGPETDTAEASLAVVSKDDAPAVETVAIDEKRVEEETCAAVAALVVDALASAEPEENLRPAAVQQQQDLRSQAGSMLEDACQDGRLLQALARSKERVIINWALTDLREQAREEVDAVREQARTQISALVEQSGVVKRDISQLHIQVKQEIGELRDNAKMAQQDINDLRDQAKMIKDLLGSFKKPPG